MKILEQIEPYQDKIKDYWNALSQREKIIAGITGAVFALAVVYSIGTQLVGVVSSLRFDSQNAQEQIADIQALAARVQNYKREATRYERLVQRRGENFQVNSFVENAARRSGVSIKSISPQRVRSGGAEEGAELYNLELESGATLEASLRFLKDLEEVIGLKILTLSMKTDFTDASKLEVKASLSFRKE